MIQKGLVFIQNEEGDYFFLKHKTGVIPWFVGVMLENINRTFLVVTDSVERPMKESDQTKDNPLTLDFDQSWGSFGKPAARLCLNTLDFSDLWDEEDSTEDEGSNSTNESSTGCLQAPPAPPPLPPPPPPLTLPSHKGASTKSRTLKLHWKELPSLAPLPRMTRFGTQTIWAGLEPVHLDTNRLEYLFESKGSSTTFNVAFGRQKQPSVSVLGMKRSNIITIALSSLPLPASSPLPSTAWTARLKELIPTEEELSLIKEAKALNPQSPLAPAELCLLTLGEIPHLNSRLQLWAFALDYDSLERARGFELSYLGKLSQVRDTNTRQPLLLHVCVLLLQLYPQSSDLYSDITAVTKAGKLEALCKASWEQLKILDKAEKKTKDRNEKKRGGGSDALASEGSLRHRLPKIFKECEERLKVLKAVHRRVINRFHSFLLFLGYSRAMVRDTKAEDFCKTISNFSLEYRSTRQAVLMQRERERQKSGSESPGPNTPVGRRKRQQTPT
ncbi:hypothetical protein F7725_004735, partial [Dissostichus mawsoni]